MRGVRHTRESEQVKQEWQFLVGVPGQIMVLGIADYQVSVLIAQVSFVDGRDRRGDRRLSVGVVHKCGDDVLDRDGRASLAAIDLVLAQPSISSQLVDNLNASVHLRALLTDLFLMSDILSSHLNSQQIR